jgi:CO dehydrogenase maturation factor
MIRLNPKVDDLVETIGVNVDGVMLMNLGTIPLGGGGCFCAPSSLLKAFLRHALSQPDEWIILDMEAGLEHLGRGSSGGVDLLIIVVEPTARSTETARRIQHLARDLGIRKVGLVVNKGGTAAEVDAVRAALPDLPLLGVIPRSAVLAAFNARVSLESLEPPVREAVASLYDSLVSA